MPCRSPGNLEPPASGACGKGNEHHIRTEGCAPFPVGPRIPRLDSALPALAAPLSLAERAICAFDVMNLELAAVEARVDGSRQTASNTKSPLWRHVHSAIEEWFQRHGDKADDPDKAPTLLDQMYRLAPGRNGPADIEYRQRIRAFHDKGSKHDLLGSFAPFCAPPYTCRCGMSAQSTVESRIESSSQVEEMVRVLDEKHGDWKLLAAVFLKLIHGHLAILPNRQFTSKSMRYDAILRVLDSIGAQGMEAHTGRMIPVAASLHFRLETIAPFVTSLRDDGSWTLDFDQLPSCFNPYLLGREATTTEQARRLLDDCAATEAAAWVDTVAYLAREVSSLITDPLVAPDLRFTRDEFKNLYDRYISDSKARGRLVAELAGADPSELAVVVIRRLPVLTSMANWMRERGLELVIAARKPLPLSGVRS